MSKAKGIARILKIIGLILIVLSIFKGCAYFVRYDTFSLGWMSFLIGGFVVFIIGRFIE